MTRVVFLLVSGLHLLDLAGPAQAFSTAGDLGCGYELHYVAEQEDVRTAQGATVRAVTNWPSLTTDDLIVVPGWRSPVIAGPARCPPARSDGSRATTPTAVRSSASARGPTRSAGPGCSTGHRCTTHHLIQDELAARYPAATVIRDVLYVVDGRVATSAGIASGIDLALHLIAVATARRSPPGSPGRWWSTRAATATSSRPARMLRHRNHLSDLAHRAQDGIEARFADPLPLADLARACGVSERTLTRRFVAATGMTPAAIPAAAPGRAGRAPDRARGDGRDGRAHGRFRRRPDASPPPSSHGGGRPASCRRLSNVGRWRFAMTSGKAP